MVEKINEGLLGKAEKLLAYEDKKILALSLNKNEKWGDNYNGVLMVKLIASLNSLNKEIIQLRKSLRFSSWVMIFMTFVIMGLTTVLVWKGLF